MTDSGKLRQIRPLGPPQDVPVFNLVIYVSTGSDGVTARVANLPELASTARSEPQALKQVITDAKSRLARWHQEGEAIPWVDPTEPTDGEQQRFVPVHL